MVSAVIVASGVGRRMGAGYNKVFMKLCGREIISWTIEVFDNCDAVDEIIVVTAPHDMERMDKICKENDFSKVKIITEGGALRQDSVYNGLKKAAGDIVLIHDGARCLVTEKIINAVIDDTKKYNAAATGVPVFDTLKIIDNNGNIMTTVDRDKTVRIQTPQGFMRNEIIALHESEVHVGEVFTDDCAVFEHCGKTVHYTKGSLENIKITTPEDLVTAKEILQRRGNV